MINLVKEQKLAGKHEVEFSAIDGSVSCRDVWNLTNSI